jgi:hypothetical protein
MHILFLLPVFATIMQHRLRRQDIYRSLTSTPQEHLPYISLYTTRSQFVTKVEGGAIDPDAIDANKLGNIFPWEVKSDSSAVPGNRRAVRISSTTIFFTH